MEMLEFAKKYIDIWYLPSTAALRYERCFVLLAKEAPYKFLRAIDIAVAGKKEMLDWYTPGPGNDKCDFALALAFMIVGGAEIK